MKIMNKTKINLGSTNQEVQASGDQEKHNSFDKAGITEI